MHLSLMSVPTFHHFYLVPSRYDHDLHGVTLYLASARVDYVHMFGLLKLKLFNLSAFWLQCGTDRCFEGHYLSP